MATKRQVIDLHRANPTWGASDIAAALDTSGEYVRATAARNGLSLPKRPTSALTVMRRAAPDLLEAAKTAFIHMVGATLAIAVERNGWLWPDDAPPTVSVPAERLRAAIAKATGA